MNKEEIYEHAFEETYGLAINFVRTVAKINRSHEYATIRLINMMREVSDLDEALEKLNAEIGQLLKENK